MCGSAPRSSAKGPRGAKLGPNIELRFASLAQGPRADVAGCPPRAQRSPRSAIGWAAPQQADQPKSAPRGRAVALEFVGADAPSAEHDRERQRAREQNALGRAAWSGPHPDQRESAAAHGPSPRIRAHEPIVEVANRLA